jgi:phospholipase C
MDSWNTARDAGYGMGFFERSDLPYYYALSDGFTVGDAHFQSTFTQTSPNRIHLFSGSNNNYWHAKERGSNTTKEWLLMDDSEAHNPGYDWPTMAETLEESKISWKVYMEEDNFDDNGFAWFDTFQKAQNGSALYEKGMKRVATNQLVKSFENDIKDGKLPSVSWLVAPANQSEHASNHPAAGEDLTARFLRVLQENPSVYAKTAFILNYDEGGQFFDHHWTPTPPAVPEDGASTADVSGDLTRTAYANVPPNTPIGMGFRVPMFIVSPWSRVKGGAVYSEVVDHTSVIQFIEKRFNVSSPNISPWRRAVAGDITAAFDFKSPPDFSWPDLPDTSGYVAAANQQCADLPSPPLPVTQSMPAQEPGVKVARPLPYAFEVDDSVHAGGDGITLKISNTGTVGAAFQVHNYGAGTDFKPKRYTIEAGKVLSSVWTNVKGYNISLHGPNGFVRKYYSASPHVATAGAAVQVVFREDAQSEAVTFEMVGAPVGAGCKTAITVRDNEYGHGGPWSFELTVNHADSANIQRQQHKVLTASSGNWYDLTATTVISGVSCDAESSYERRYMGKVETIHATTTDPSMAKAKPAGTENEHPRLSEATRQSMMLAARATHPIIGDNTDHAKAAGWDTEKDLAAVCKTSPYKDACFNNGL